MRKLLPALGGRRLLAAAAGLALAALVTGSAVASNGKGSGNDRLQRINHIVVIYEENHSFDNLYGGWEGVRGLSDADVAHTTQVDQNGTPYSCLFQNDANLTVPPLEKVCSGVTPRGVAFDSHFTNTWFSIDDFIHPQDITCPPITNAFAFPNGIRNPGINPATGQPVPGARAGGCTRDIVHKFYQEIYQLNGGAQNRYATGSDAAGLVMGVYDTRQLPIYRYLHGGGAPHYGIADNFFQAAFGGSFLNHQWLIAAATPVYPGAPASFHSILDTAGFNHNNYPLYNPLAGATYRDGDLTVECTSPVKPEGACGDYAVNTMQPSFWPKGTFGDVLVPQTNPTIGDRLNAKGIDWAWYAGGWDNAVGNTTGRGYTNGPGPTCADPNHDPRNSSYPRCPDGLFQYHHQPFNYYTAFDPSTPAGAANRQAHLQDEENFIAAAASSSKSCDLKAVSFIKPVGAENEHPGYASEPNGSDHLVDLLQSIENSDCAKDTMVIVTYDEFGGQWDHVPPPGQGDNNGPHDSFGPGTRIPALIISPFLRGNEVIDHTQYDTTSILATIEQRYGLAALATRDAAVNSLSDVFEAKQYEAAK
jgi:acid phosphatase